jgi:hypothetical protein
MKLQPLTLITPKIQASDIFPALELIMSHQAIEEAITKTNSQEKRHRLLPTHLIITLVIALNLWSKDSVLDVLKNLVQGLSSSWIPKGIKWRMPSKSSISEARQRVGCAVMTRLFEKLAQPMATMKTPSAFLNGLRWMAIDGTVEEYHWRWEVENTLSEFKTHLNGRKIPIRSKKPKLVVQEIYGWLIAHWAIRSLIFQASTTTEQSPLRFSFTGSLRILRRAISCFQQALPSSLPYFFSWLISEISEQIIPPRQGRTNPRVIKKPRSKFKGKKSLHRTGFTQLQPLTFAVVPAA